MTIFQFHVATDKEIKEGKVTDVYFQRTKEILEKKNIHKHVVAEIRASSLPEGYNWAILAGIEEAAHLLEGVKATVLTMPEGTMFHAEEPVLTIEGDYVEFAIYETPLLGLLCQASGIATKAARCKKAAAERPVISFGARRMHPAIAPMIERNAFIGGCDSVAVVKSAELLNIEPSGTMPHALILVMGNPIEAFKSFHEIAPSHIKRVCLVDTLEDEKFEAVRAAETLAENLFAVRLDTPSSRRGNMKTILEEVRWELDLRGFNHVKLMLSGGVDEYEILKLNPVVDAYGVGTSISNAPVINLAMDIVEVEGKPLAKRGKKAGKKDVSRCDKCMNTKVVPFTSPAKSAENCTCGGTFKSIIFPLTQEGKLVRDLPTHQQIREYVLSQLSQINL